MTCCCCGAKKKLFEMFYSVEAGDQKLSFCRECRDVVERLESDMAGGEKELYAIHLLQLQKRSKNPTPAFRAWQRTHFPPE